MGERLTLVCSQCSRTSDEDPGGWYSEWEDGHETFYCRRCWSQTGKGAGRQAKPDWKGNARARRDLLRPFKDQTVVAVWAREREGPPFPIRVGSLDFLDLGQTYWTGGGLDDWEVETTEDLFAGAWIYRCPVRTWPIPFVEGLSPWDFTFGGAQLRIRRSLNGHEVHDQLLEIVRTTTPTGNPDSSAL
jgi:hypothetical protein